MIIGVPKEIKVGENRVGATPSGVDRLVKAGHKVLIEKGAGEGSGFSDEEYRGAGAELMASSNAVWKAEMVLKIKEPIEPEFKFFRHDLLLFTYLHLANPELNKLTRFLMDKKVTAIAYETIQLQDGRLPLLAPMSVVAGKMATQVVAYYLEKTHGGRGVLIGGAPGVNPCNVVIIGAGTVGRNAASVALGMGANVIVIDLVAKKLRHLVETLGTVYGDKLTTARLSRRTVAKALREADAVIGAVLTAGARAPILITREMVRSMKPGSVIVDVDIDQGGIFETARPTTHEDPIYKEEGVTHYCVTNMPGAVPRSSTIALTNSSLPFVLEVANLGLVQAIRKDPALAKGVNVYAGCVTNQEVAKAHGLEYKPLENMI